MKKSWGLGKKLPNIGRIQKSKGVDYLLSDELDETGIPNLLERSYDQDGKVKFYNRLPDGSYRETASKKYQSGGPIDSLITPMPRSSTFVNPKPFIDPRTPAPKNQVIDPTELLIINEVNAMLDKPPYEASMKPRPKRVHYGNSSRKSKSKDRFREKANGGFLEDLSKMMGNINPIIGAAGAAIPAIASIFSKPDHTIVSGSPGNYATGGDVPLSSSAFQVQGNPNVTDGNTYGDVKLDHNEVITDTAQGKFVYSDDLKHSSGKSYAMLAKKYESAKGKAEKVLQVSPYDEQAKSTISQSNRLLEQLASEQEAQATAMGLRNEDGSTKQQFRTGGMMRYASGGPGDPIYMSLPNQPNYFYDPYKNRLLERNKYTGQYTPFGSEVTDRYRPTAGAIAQHLRKYPGETPTGPVPNPLADPLQSLQNNQYTPQPSAPSTPKKAAANKPAQQPAKNKYDWLNYGRDFMKQLDETTPTSDRPDMEGYTGMPTIKTTADQRADIVSTGSPVVTNPESDMEVQNMSLYTPPGQKDEKYKTPWTVGDTFKLFELGAKGIGAFGSAEKEKPLLDNTQITQETYDPSNALYQSQRTFQNFANATPTSSINLRRSLLNSALASKYSTDNQIMSQYDNMNQQSRSNYQGRVANQRQFNINSQANTNNLNAANRAAQDALQQNFFTSVGQFGEDLNRKRYANDVINLLQQQYPGIFNSYIKH